MGVQMSGVFFCFVLFFCGERGEGFVKMQCLLCVQREGMGSRVLCIQYMLFCFFLLHRVINVLKLIKR